MSCAITLVETRGMFPREILKFTTSETAIETTYTGKKIGILTKIISVIDY